MSANPSRTPLLLLALERMHETPLHRQIYDQVRDAILSGRLAPGAKLPSSRALAQDQGISRNTVISAYDQLFAEGYVEGRTGSGTRVSEVLPEALLSARGVPQRDRPDDRPGGKLSRLARQAVAGEPRTGRRAVAFGPGIPDIRQFPFEQWSRAVARFWRRPPADLLHAGNLAGYRPLRQAIAQYLGAVRGLDCEADQVVITAGAQQALDLTARALLDAGDRVWLEDPGYGGLRGVFAASGAATVPVPVDGHGLSVAAGLELAADAVLAAVTPSHQYPLGVTMSLARRLELLDWASRGGAWILEDDYDSEYRYAGRPLASLQGLDEGGRVIYVGTFSKVLFPALRLGYAVVPPALVAPFLAVRAALDDQPSIAVQPALAEFMADGRFAAHIRRMRGLYEARQRAMIEALGRTGVLTAEPDEAGMHLIARLDPGLGIDDVEASRRAAAAGLNAPALSSYYAGAAERQGLVLGYAAVDEGEIEAGVEKLAAAITEAV